MSTADQAQDRVAPPTADALRAAIDGPRAAVRDSVRETLARPELAQVNGTLERDEYREQVFTWAKLLASEGTASIGLPAEYGGQGDVGGSVVAFETLAHGDLSLLVKFGVQFGLFGGAVLHLGSKPHHDRYLRDIGTLDLPGCFAMTESGHGSDVQSIGTTATYDGDTREFVVHTPHPSARKDYIGNAAVHGRMAAVFTQLEVGGEHHGVHAILVPIRDENGDVLAGVTVQDDGPKLGLNGVDNGRLSFDHVRVPRENLLDRFAHVTEDGRYLSEIEDPNKRFFTMLGTLVQGRVSVSGGALGATKAALAIAVRHAQHRRQFGPPGGPEITLMQYRTHQRRLLPRIARTYAIHFAQMELVEQFDHVFTGEDVSDQERRELEGTAAGMKALSTWHATASIQECREACGGWGYLAESRLPALKSDTDVFTTFEGDNTVLLQLVAKGLLTGYQAQFGDLDPLGMVGFVAGQVLETFTTRSGVRQVIEALGDIVPVRDDEGVVRDRVLQQELLSWREGHMLSTLARRVKRGLDDGHDPFLVFSSVQDHVVKVAEVHIERRLLDAFAGAVERCEDPAARASLDRLCDLFALTVIEADRAWYLEQGRISPARAKAVRHAVGELCYELRDEAQLYVDAWGVPDALIPSAQDQTSAPAPG